MGGPCGVRGFTFCPLHSLCVRELRLLLGAVCTLMRRHNGLAEGAAAGSCSWL